MASNIQQFEQMVAQLMSPDNAVRQHAEAAFNETKKNPDFCVLSLVELVRNSQIVEVRSLSLVLLRRNIRNFKESLWPALSEPGKEQVKSSLLEFLDKEQNTSVRKKIADCIGELANTIFDPVEKQPAGTWNDLLPFLFRCVKSNFEGHRETALFVFEQLASEIAPQLRPHHEVLRNIFVEGLQDATSLKVRVAALGATASFLRILEENEQANTRSQKRMKFQQLLPLMLGTVSAALNSQKKEEARSAIQLFVELAEVDPTFFRPFINEITNAMMTIASASQLEEDTRQLGVEFLITLAENRPGMVRKMPQFLDHLIPIITHMMLQIQEDEDWNTGLEDEDDIDITDSDIGEEALDRLALALGGKVIVPMLLSPAGIPALLQDPDWRKRHTALMMVSIIGEGTSTEFEPRLPEIVSMVVKYIQDPHPRVRWAASNALGQMSSDFGPGFQENYHQQTVPALISLMSDKANPRVQSHCAAAMINFCERATPTILEPYLTHLLNNLLGLLQEGKVFVQEQAVTAIASIADCLQGNFVTCYDHVMPYLKNILANANDKEYRMLRGKAMECISLIGVAVGKAKFYQDAKEVMEQLNKTQTSTLENDDPQVSFLLQSWARICKCMGRDFVPYLSYVMPPLLNSASIKPDVSITDSEDNQSLPEGYDQILIGDKKIGINTSALEEKATACNMLFCYASELQEGFFPYVDQVSRLLVPLMKFYYNDGVRQAALTTMPQLIISAKQYFKTAGAPSGANQLYVSNLWNFMFRPFVESLSEEADPEILMDGISAFTSTIQAMGENCLTQEQFQAISAMVKHLIQEAQERRRLREERAREEDHDDEEGEKIEAEQMRDEGIITAITEVVGAITQNCKELMLAGYAEILAPFFEMVKPDKIASDRQLAVFVFDDLVEYLGPQSLIFFQFFFPYALQYVNDKDPAVRQASVYGMGLCAQHGGEQVAPVMKDVVSRLHQAIMEPNSRSDELINPTENAIGAIAKVLKYQPNTIDQAQLIPLFLSFLPVTSDTVESKVTYGIVCDLIEQNNPHVLGANLQNVPKIVSIFADALKTNLVDDALTTRIAAILRKIGTTLSREDMGKIWTSLTPEQQQKLGGLFSS